MTNVAWRASQNDLLYRMNRSQSVDRIDRRTRAVEGRQGGGVLIEEIVDEEVVRMKTSLSHT